MPIVSDPTIEPRQRLRRSKEETTVDYDKQLEAVAPFVESEGADGLYEIVEEYTS